MSTPIRAIIATGATITLLPSLVYMPILGILGFSPGGIVAGTIASFSQSQVGNLVAGSVISICQSAAAGGYGAAIVGGITQVCGGLMAAGGAIWAGFKHWSADGENDGDGSPTSAETRE